MRVAVGDARSGPGHGVFGLAYARGGGVRIPPGTFDVGASRTGLGLGAR